MIGQGLPENWSTYGNASGDIDLVAAGDDTSSETQTGDSQILSWSFDANADPGFGGIRKDFSKPQNWTGFTGIQFLYFGGGVGGELQLEIGEDRTEVDRTDVERYRTRSFFDRTEGWQLIRLPFESFSPARFNPRTRQWCPRLDCGRPACLISGIQALVATASQSIP